MTDDELKAFGQTWAEAERNGDLATLDALLSDDFCGVGPLGFILTKDGWLGRYKSGDLVHKTFEWAATNIRTFGDTAILIGVQTQETTYQGRQIDGGRLRLTHVLIRQGDGSWRIVSIHISNLADNAA